MMKNGENTLQRSVMSGYSLEDSASAEIRDWEEKIEQATKI